MSEVLVRVREVPVSVRELVVLDGCGIVTDSFQVLGIAEVGGPQIDAVARLSKSHGILPSTQGLCRQQHALPKAHV